MRYVLDQAEIPTFQQRGLARAEVLRRIRAEVARGGARDGRRAARRAAVAARAPTLALRSGGQAGCARRASSSHCGRRRATRARVVLRDDTLPRPGRLARDRRVSPGRGTAVRTARARDRPDAPPYALSRACSSRPRTCAWRGSTCARATARSSPAASAGAQRAGARRTGSPGCSPTPRPVRACCSCSCWPRSAGVRVHALSPGHGKAMVAAYLVGTRGTARQAVALGATVTVTHTAGVVRCSAWSRSTLSQYVLPEDLYPWLNLAAGLLVLGVGAAVLRGRVRGARTASPSPPPRHARRTRCRRAGSWRWASPPG